MDALQGCFDTDKNRVEEDALYPRRGAGHLQVAGFSLASLP